MTCPPVPLRACRTAVAVVLLASTAPWPLAATSGCGASERGTAAPGPVAPPDAARAEVPAGIPEISPSQPPLPQPEPTPPAPAPVAPDDPCRALVAEFQRVAATASSCTSDRECACHSVLPYDGRAGASDRATAARLQRIADTFFRRPCPRLDVTMSAPGPCVARCRGGRCGLAGSLDDAANPG